MGDLRRLACGLRGGRRAGETRGSWSTSSSAQTSSATRRSTAVVTACPAEKSGQDEFDFEHGNEFSHYIDSFRPTFCKVLVRYNPEGDVALNRRQVERLKQLSDYLHPGGPSKFMFELLVPATTAQLERCRRRQEGI